MVQRMPDPAQNPTASIETAPITASGVPTVPISLQRSSTQGFAHFEHGTALEAGEAPHRTGRPAQEVSRDAGIATPHAPVAAPLTEPTTRETHSLEVVSVSPELSGMNEVTRTLRRDPAEMGASGTSVATETKPASVVKVSPLLSGNIQVGAGRGAMVDAAGQSSRRSVSVQTGGELPRPSIVHRPHSVQRSSATLGSPGFSGSFAVGGPRLSAQPEAPADMGRNMLQDAVGRGRFIDSALGAAGLGGGRSETAASAPGGQGAENSRRRPQTPNLDINGVVDQVYQMLVRRLASERQRKGL
jgi:hypothetical protein